MHDCPHRRRRGRGDESNENHTTQRRPRGQTRPNRRLRAWQLVRRENVRSKK